MPHYVRARVAHDTTLDAFAPAESAQSGLQTTMSWTPDGDSCAACGRTVNRRWRDESGLVCVDCKQWNRS